MTFLAGLDSRPVALKDLGAEEAQLYLGQGDGGLEAVVADLHDAKPDQIRKAWKARQGGRVAPVLLILLRGRSCTIVGPTAEDQSWSTTSVEAADRLVRAALLEPNRHAAIR